MSSGSHASKSRASLRALARFVVVLACALFAPLSACKSGGKFPEKWEKDELAVPSDRLLWEVTVFALEKEHFPVGTGLDPTTLIATSGWKHSLAPFRSKGWREQAQVRYQRVAPGRYSVEVRVAKELNDDIARPLDLRYAKWEEAADDEEAARVLLQRIKSWVGMAGPQPAKPSTAGRPR